MVKIENVIIAGNGNFKNLLVHSINSRSRIIRQLFDVFFGIKVSNYLSHYSRYTIQCFKTLKLA